jgi:DNA invertase Pin-like site-specific DNA recombinase
MRLVGYIRCSTDRQAEEGLGLEVQEQAIREWAQAHGHELVSLTRDEGISGSNGLDTRVGLGDALEALRGGRAEGLVVYRLDRLARDLIVQETLLAEVWRMGREVFSTSTAEQGYLQDDPHDPSRKLIRQVLGAVNEYERSMISLRLRAGRLRKAQNGGYPGGKIKFGYKGVDGVLVPDPKEQRTQQRIETLRSEGKTLREIAKVLNREGRKPRTASVWHPGTLGPIIKRMEVGA